MSTCDNNIMRLQRCHSPAFVALGALLWFPLLALLSGQVSARPWWPTRQLQRGDDRPTGLPDRPSATPGKLSLGSPNALSSSSVPGAADSAPLGSNPRRGLSPERILKVPCDTRPESTCSNPDHPWAGISIPLVPQGAGVEAPPPPSNPHVGGSSETPHGRVLKVPCNTRPESTCSDPDHPWTGISIPLVSHGAGVEAPYSPPSKPPSKPPAVDFSEIPPGRTLQVPCDTRPESTCLRPDRPWAGISVPLVSNGAGAEAPDYPPPSTSSLPSSRPAGISSAVPGDIDPEVPCNACSESSSSKLDQSGSATNVPTASHRPGAEGPYSPPPSISSPLSGHSSEIPNGLNPEDPCNISSEPSSLETDRPHAPESPSSAESDEPELGAPHVAPSSPNSQKPSHSGQPEEAAIGASSVVPGEQGFGTPYAAPSSSTSPNFGDASQPGVTAKGGTSVLSDEPGFETPYTTPSSPGSPEFSNSGAPGAAIDATPLVSGGPGFEAPYAAPSSSTSPDFGDASQPGVTTKGGTSVLSDEPGFEMPYTTPSSPGSPESSNSSAPGAAIDATPLVSDGPGFEAPYAAPSSPSSPNSSNSSQPETTIGGPYVIPNSPGVGDPFSPTSTLNTPKSGDSVPPGAAISTPSAVVVSDEPAFGAPYPVTESSSYMISGWPGAHIDASSVIPHVPDSKGTHSVLANSGTPESPQQTSAVIRTSASLTPGDPFPTQSDINSLESGRSLTAISRSIYSESGLGPHPTLPNPNSLSSGQPWPSEAAASVVSHGQSLGIPFPAPSYSGPLQPGRPWSSESSVPIISQGPGVVAHSGASDPGSLTSERPWPSVSGASGITLMSGLEPSYSSPLNPSSLTDGPLNSMGTHSGSVQGAGLDFPYPAPSSSIAPDSSLNRAATSATSRMSHADGLQSLDPAATATGSLLPNDSEEAIPSSRYMSLGANPGPSYPIPSDPVPSDPVPSDPVPSDPSPDVSDGFSNTVHATVISSAASSQLYATPHGSLSILGPAVSEAPLINNPTHSTLSGSIPPLGPSAASSDSPGSASIASDVDFSTPKGVQSVPLSGIETSATVPIMASGTIVPEVGSSESGTRPSMTALHPSAASPEVSISATIASDADFSAPKSVQSIPLSGDFETQAAAATLASGTTPSVASPEAPVSATNPSDVDFSAPKSVQSIPLSGDFETPATAATLASGTTPSVASPEALVSATIPSDADFSAPKSVQSIPLSSDFETQATAATLASGTTPSVASPEAPVSATIPSNADFSAPKSIQSIPLSSDFDTSATASALASGIIAPEAGSADLETPPSASYLSPSAASPETLISTTIALDADVSFPKDVQSVPLSGVFDISTTALTTPSGTIIPGESSSILETAQTASQLDPSASFLIAQTSTTPIIFSASSSSTLGDLEPELSNAPASSSTAPISATALIASQTSPSPGDLKSTSPFSAADSSPIVLPKPTANIVSEASSRFESAAETTTPLAAAESSLPARETTTPIFFTSETGSDPLETGETIPSFTSAVPTTTPATTTTSVSPDTISSVSALQSQIREIYPLIERWTEDEGEDGNNSSDDDDDNDDDNDDDDDDDDGELVILAFMKIKPFAIRLATQLGGLKPNIGPCGSGGLFRKRRFPLFALLEIVSSIVECVDKVIKGAQVL